jgi:hypothetical protein
VPTPVPDRTGHGRLGAKERGRRARCAAHIGDESEGAQLRQIEKFFVAHGRRRSGRRMFNASAIVCWVISFMGLYSFEAIKYSDASPPVPRLAGGLRLRFPDICFVYRA